MHCGRGEGKGRNTGRLALISAVHQPRHLPRGNLWLRGVQFYAPILPPLDRWTHSHIHNLLQILQHARSDSVPRIVRGFSTLRCARTTAAACRCGQRWTVQTPLLFTSAAYQARPISFCVLPVWRVYQQHIGTCVSQRVSSPGFSSSPCPALLQALPACPFPPTQELDTIVLRPAAPKTPVCVLYAAQAPNRIAFRSSSDQIRTAHILRWFFCRLRDCIIVRKCLQLCFWS